MRQDTEHWYVLNSGVCEYAFNMALDEVLLENAIAQGRPVLRFYGWQQQAASFGYFQHIADIEAVTHLRPLVRRSTGGGLVPHDRDWTYSVTVPPSHQWYHLHARESYERMHQWLRAAFAELDIETELATIARKETPGQCFAGYEQHDLLWHGRKIAGAAQRRTRDGLLIQGSVQSQPPGVTRAQWEEAMDKAARRTWKAVLEAWHLPAAVAARAEHLRAEKYARDSYNRKR